MKIQTEAGWESNRTKDRLETEQKKKNKRREGGGGWEEIGENGRERDRTCHISLSLCLVHLKRKVPYSNQPTKVT
jgi:hypothetical protein